MADAFWLNFDESDGATGSALDFTLWSADVNIGWELWEWKRERIVNGETTDTGVVARVIPYAGLRLVRSRRRMSRRCGATRAEV